MKAYIFFSLAKLSQQPKHNQRKIGLERLRKSRAWDANANAITANKNQVERKEKVFGMGYLGQGMGSLGHGVGLSGHGVGSLGHGVGSLGHG